MKTYAPIVPYAAVAIAPSSQRVDLSRRGARRGWNVEQAMST